jgi:hypothetical protein
MKKLYLLVSILAVGAGAAARLPSARVTASIVGNENNLKNDRVWRNSGAFRDGLYLGKFTAEQGGARRVVSGRWATADNRALFAAGYEQGYGEIVAGRDRELREKTQ